LRHTGWWRGRGVELGQQVGHHERRRPEAVVDHDLGLAALDQLDVDGRLQGDGVVLEGAGREADLADLAGQCPPEVLPVEEPLDLALAAFGQVESPAVEEADDDRLRVVLHEAHGDSAHGVGLSRQEPGDRDRRHLEVEDVDTGGVDPRHHRPLEHSGRP